MEYNQIFQPQTLEKLNKRSQDNLKKIMGNKSLMQTMISSGKLLQEIMAIEAPYKEQLEQLAIQMVEDMYPIVIEDNIKIDAKITSVADVNQSLDENINESTPEAKRRVINGITQGAALNGTFSFYMFKEYLDVIDDTLVEKYNQLMKEVFGVYDDDNAVAMFLNAIAQGQKTGGGSSKVIINEIKVNKPNQYIFKCNDGSSYMGTLFFNGKIISTKGYLCDMDSIVEINEKPKFKEEDFYYFHGGYRLNKPFIIKNQSPINEIKVNKPPKPWDFESPINIGDRITTPWKNHKGIIFTYTSDGVLTASDGTTHGVSPWKKMYEYDKKFNPENIINNPNKLNLEESNESGITIRARAICFPMLVHEIIKGLYELVSLQGFSGTKDQNQAVVDKVDKLENEPHDLKYGKFIYEALNNIFADSDYNDSRIKEFFFAEVYQMGDIEFVEFIENAINEQLSPFQKKWVDQTLKEIAMDLKSDDFDSTGLDEITINKPGASYNPNRSENIRKFEFGKNVRETLYNFIKTNQYLSEKQIVTYFSDSGTYNPKTIQDNIRMVPNLKRQQVLNPITKKKIYVYHI